ncbi:hypothetical protein [Campylobacter lari]|uniref:hypothetical protein n=1 Tax=Campylobacter lari TaxID=201 RepID=UPI002149FC31|nr:hypothetical protein [Campylobacter lari]EGK7475008.1 hypothetical protein [Campylobacter lari]MCR2072969.1 hypothetical protein [Campylobacter lari subsp. concheus]MCV3368002.1 hypothetical protein [Campylobacter lari]
MKTIITICGIPIFKKVIFDRLKKYYLLNIPFFKIQIFNKSKKYSLLGIPFLKIHYSNKITDLFINEQKSTNEIENILQRLFKYEIENILQRLFKYNIVKESDVAFLNIKKSINKEKNAVFGVLPPEKTGIAIFNYNAFVDCECFDMFSDIRDLSIAKGLSKNVFDLKTFIKFDASYLYKKFIYILGNSSHNNPYLHMAKSSVDKQKSWLYIHEANLNNLLFSHCNGNFLAMKEYLIKYYPEFNSELVKLKNFQEFRLWNEELKIYGLRVIVGLTNIHNFIVNNNLCKKLILNELKDYKVNIAEVFLPLPKIINTNSFISKKNSNIIYVGSFGVPHEIKFSLEIAQAIEYLNEYKNLNIKLLIVGYGANVFFKKNNFNKSYVEIYENVSDIQFYSLIRLVDLVIQLRKKPHGESSGPIVSALALDKKIITSKDFVDKKIEEKVFTMDNCKIDYKIIAEKILECIQTSNDVVNYSEIKKTYTYSNLAKLLDEL